MKWITCSGCDERKVVPHAASFCSPKCRNRVWRRRRGIAAANRCRAFCACCDSPLVYMPQDRLPAARSYCDNRCARQAWLTARARALMTSIKALDIATRRLRKSRKPTILAAAFALADLRQELLDQQEADRTARVAAFVSKLPRAA
jgi:hypothetical protein